jgi:hypothetical protein
MRNEALGVKGKATERILLSDAVVSGVEPLPLLRLAQHRFWIEGDKEMKKNFRLRFLDSRSANRKSKIKWL